MKRRIRLYFKFVAQHLKMMLAYRADFAIGILSFAVQQAAGIIFLDVLVKATGIASWTYYELLVIYAMFQIPRGFDHLLTDNLWLVGFYIRQGLFDKYLVRPMSVLRHLIIERFQLEALGELIVGFLLLGYALPKLGVVLSFVDVVLLIGFVAAGAATYTGIKLLTASVAFWTMDSQAVQSAAYEVAIFTKNPIEIYPKGIRFVLVYLLPFGFTSYFPSVFLLSKMADAGVLSGGLDWILWKTPGGMLLQAAVTAILFILAGLALWNRGLSRYESAGS
ncbi:MAG: ABC-2 family transporter protein [Candidatus Izemoplasmatales bacterium]